MFYMATRYDGAESSTTDLELANTPDAALSVMGNLSTLLAWHEEDPVSEEERVRGGKICTLYQHNRNPFIDFPEWASCIFADDCIPLPPAPFVPPSSPAPPCPPPDLTPKPPPSPAPPSPPPSPPPSRPLSAGDCAVIALHADNPDDAAVVLLTSLAAGRQIMLTDSGARADGTLRDGEGILSHTAVSDEVAGTVLRLENFSAVSGSFALAVTGDQLIVFTGTRLAPTFLCALSTAGEQWDATADSPATSALPNGLTHGVDALALAHKANYEYSGPTSGTADALRAAIMDQTLWIGANDEKGPIPQYFTVQSVSLLPPPTSSPSLPSTSPPPTAPPPAAQTCSISAEQLQARCACQMVFDDAGVVLSRPQLNCVSQ
mmetsp:Transcript_58543/g.116257  ORF Transcript_58543/g.116257 Transcript_58543/m.116257 type:complete len:376 (-) Transcript_58543:219-1346(-)